MNCVFCNIVNRTEKSYIIWENNSYMAFLSIFPNTPGFTVVIPKIHYSSYCFELPSKILSELIFASKEVSKLLEKAYSCRVGMIMEGFGIDHAHTKLIPMHGTSLSQWNQINSNVDKYFNKYEGYLSTHNGPRSTVEELEKNFNLIKNG